MTGLLEGGFAVAVASFLAGMTGFAYGLVATPLLLLAGFSLPFVVTVNLTLALVTRISVAYRLRGLVDRQRVGLLIGGSVPGLYLGAWTLGSVDPTPITIALGVLVMVLALVLATRRFRARPPRPSRCALAGASFVGGFLGALTSLNGIVPALLLAREEVAPLAFIADLAVYFVVSNAIGLAVLSATGAVSMRALLHGAPLWLCGALVANAAGVALAPKVPERAFRHLTLAIVLVAGAVTTATAR